MSSGTNLPPQAYTREILTSAFNWLQTQPDSIRKAATTPDILVGLYTRAKRFASSTPENDAPVSSQNFMSDLKNLAEGLKEFEEPQSNPHRVSIPSSNQVAPTRPGTSFSNIPNGVGLTFAANKTGGIFNGTPSGTPGGTASAPEKGLENPGTFVTASLSERSRTMIQEVKTQLNLTTDAEAVNMMLAVAYKSLKNLLA